MAFLGGLLSGMSTSTMGFITGAAEETQRQLNPEPVEMTDAEKIQMKFRYDTLGKEYDKLNEVKDVPEVRGFLTQSFNGMYLLYREKLFKNKLLNLKTTHKLTT
jgi:hypothetical protein